MIPSASNMFPASDICFPFVSRHGGAGGEKQFGMLKKLSEFQKLICNYLEK